MTSQTIDREYSTPSAARRVQQPSLPKRRGGWRIALALCCVGLLALVTGCGQSQDSSPAPVAPAPNPEPVTNDVPLPSEPTAEQVPVAEDFADEAEQGITETNYRDELDRIAGEVQADLERGGAGDEG